MGGKGGNPLFWTSKVSTLRTYDMLRVAFSFYGTTTQKQLQAPSQLSQAVWSCAWLRPAKPLLCSSAGDLVDLADRVVPRQSLADRALAYLAQYCPVWGRARSTREVTAASGWATEHPCVVPCGTPTKSISMGAERGAKGHYQQISKMASF